MHAARSARCAPAPDAVRRRLLLGLAGLGSALAGCSATPNLQLTRESMNLAMADKDVYPRTRAEIDALPYAQLGVRFAGGGRGIMVLADAGAELRWVSANRVLLATRRGRVVRTQGLARDLRTTSFVGPDFLESYVPGASSWAPPKTERLIDVTAPDEFGVRVTSQTRVIGPQAIQIAGLAIDTLRVEEDFEAPAWKWRGTNYYWLSRESRLVWRSVQQLGPDVPVVELEILKRPPDEA